jgi:hypothetical protein
MMGLTGMQIVVVDGRICVAPHAPKEQSNSGKAHHDEETTPAR